MQFTCIYVIDPPAEVNMTTPIDSASVNLTKGFGEHIFEASAESSTAITCKSIMITWLSQTRGNISIHQEEGKYSSEALSLIQLHRMFTLVFPSG